MAGPDAPTAPLPGSRPLYVSPAGGPAPIPVGGAVSVVDTFDPATLRLDTSELPSYELNPELHPTREKLEDRSLAFAYRASRDSSDPNDQWIARAAERLFQHFRDQNQMYDDGWRPGVTAFVCMVERFLRDALTRKIDQIEKLPSSEANIQPLRDALAAITEGNPASPGARLAAPRPGAARATP